MRVWIASNFLSNLLIYVFGLHLVFYPLLSDPVSAEIPELPARGLSIFADLSGFFLLSAFLAALTIGSLGSLPLITLLGLSGEVVSSYPFFVVAILHLVLEAVVGGHIYVAILCIFGGLRNIFTNLWPWVRRCLICAGEAYLFSKPRPPIHQPWQDQRLGAPVAKAQVPTGLGKLLDAFHHRADPPRFWDLLACTGVLYALTTILGGVIAIRAGCSTCRLEMGTRSGTLKLAAGQRPGTSAPSKYHFWTSRRCLSSISIWIGGQRRGHFRLAGPGRGLGNAAAASGLSSCGMYAISATTQNQSPRSAVRGGYG